jgi:hypothetical protein
MSARTAGAVPITDVQDYASNTATEYFVDIDANKYNSPYYRSQREDWGYAHNAIAGTFSSIVLEISAFDVDEAFGEFDDISVWDGASWVTIGNLDGASDIWAFTSFDLTGYAWAETQVNAGLQVQMNIDRNNAGWLVTFGKSTLSLDGGNQQCVPTPGVPCNTVPEPTSMALVGLALSGLGLRRLKNKASAK